MALWRIKLGPEDWVMEDWETFSALFDRIDGNTHLLSAVSAEVFQLLAQSPGNQEELGERLAREHALSLDADLSHAIHKALQQLEALQLIVRDSA